MSHRSGAAFLAAVLVVVSKLAAASACYVAPAGVASGSCPSNAPCDLAYAIAQIASCEGTILLNPGTYGENVDITQDGSVRLIGLGSGVILQGTGTGMCGVQVDSTGSAQVWLRNLEVLGTSLGTTPGSYSDICINASSGGVSMTLDHVVVTGAPGAGIELFPGTDQLTILDSAIVGNGTSSVTSIGGIYLHHGANLLIDRSLIAGNTNNYDPQGGGGLHIFNTGGYPATITNTTFAGNQAKRAAAISMFSVTLTLNNVTLAADNTAIDGSIMNASSSVAINHSIIAGACESGSSAVAASSAGSIESPGDTCGLPAGGSNMVNVTLGQLLLGALANNGGPTQTMLPQAGSVAIGNGGTGCELVDQRDFFRGGACDVGAAQANATIVDEIYRGSFEF